MHVQHKAVKTSILIWHFFIILLMEHKILQKINLVIRVILIGSVHPSDCILPVHIIRDVRLSC